jgi:hypothetical protein
VNPLSLDESGSAHEWWLLLKFPKNSASTDTKYAAGEAHALTCASEYDPNTGAGPSAFAYSSKKLSNSSSALGKTLALFFAAKSQPDKFAMFGYNDDTPLGTASSYYAHAKGAFLVNGEGALWISHSMPNFVDLTKDSYTVPASGLTYAQHYFCLSLGPAAADRVALGLQYNNPQLYDVLYDVSSNPNLASSYPNLAALLTGTKRNVAEPWVAAFATLGGLWRMTHFAKNAKWGLDLYSRLVAPTLDTHLFVETWMRPYEAAYYTDAYEAVNVKNLQYRVPGSDAAVSWTETQDHSKWAISTWPGKSFVCLCDVNKQKSQWGRGGGGVCFQHYGLWVVSERQTEDKHEERKTDRQTDRHTDTQTYRQTDR